MLAAVCHWMCAHVAHMAVQVSVDVPDQKGRLEILKVHARNKKLGEDVDLKEVASRVPGFTGADLANLLNEVDSPAPLIEAECLCWQCHP